MSSMLNSILLEGLAVQEKPVLENDRLVFTVKSYRYFYDKLGLNYDKEYISVCEETGISGLDPVKGNAVYRETLHIYVHIQDQKLIEATYKQYKKDRGCRIIGRLAPVDYGALGIIPEHIEWKTIQKESK